MTPSKFLRFFILKILLLKVLPLVLQSLDQVIDLDSILRHSSIQILHEVQYNVLVLEIWIGNRLLLYNKSE